MRPGRESCTGGRGNRSETRRGGESIGRTKGVVVVVVTEDIAGKADSVKGLSLDGGADSRAMGTICTSALCSFCFGFACFSGT